MSVLELEKLVDSLSEEEKHKLRELLDCDSNQRATPSEGETDISWLDQLQAEAKAICEREGVENMPTDLAATFRQRKRERLIGPYNSDE